MESSARLDYVLFHLTPTRTRCDLVIFAGKLNEKIAYGLLEPFIAHLRAVKDQISKGGYSVTLRPNSPVHAHWFTKSTLQRFVRFVSTPEVLERFIIIEREILQLENSIKSYEASDADGKTEGNAVNGNSKNSAAFIKSYSEPKGGEPEENSKARLQRVVETRQAVLRKEQAMVYARALAAGFEMDNLHDLLMFSDAFGASRLREACINFNELCKKKNEDRLWVDEIAAMQAMMQPELSYLGTSGIILTGEENDPSQNFGTGGKQNGSTDASLSDSFTSNGSSDANQGQVQPNDAKLPTQNPWANQFPPYLRNFQGPMYQQMPPYQGYGFPGIQVAPQYYPANLPWPSDVNGSTDREIHTRGDHKSSSRKKGKASKARGSENEENGGSDESSGSSSETETDSSSEKSHRRKHGKKSSRKVVIRNINYISSKRNEEKSGASESESSHDDSYLDGDSLKQQLEKAVGSFEKHQKSNSHRHKKRSGSKHLDSANQDDDEVVSSQNGSGKRGNEDWGALQDLLLKEESDSIVAEPHSVGVEECLDVKRSEELNSYAFKPDAETLPKRKPDAGDAFLVTEMGTAKHNSGIKVSDESFEHSEKYHPVVRRGGTPEEFMFSQRSEETESYSRLPISDDSASLSVIKNHASDDCYISQQSDYAVNQGGTSHLIFADGEYVKSSNDQVEKKNKDFIDDSLMVQGRLADDYSEPQLRTDISLVSDIFEANFIEKGSSEVVPQKNSESAGFYESDELYMVLDRDAVVEQTVPSWSPELDYENNISAKKSDVDACPDLTADQNSSNNKKNGATVAKASGRDARSRIAGGPLRKGKPEATPGTRRSTFGSKTTTSRTQAEKDEERRKRLEQLVIQRQKRIADRSGASLASSRKPPGHKPGTASLSDKSKLQPSGEETKKPKPVLRSSTIERLATAKTTPKTPTVQPKKEASKVKSANAKSGSQKTTGTDPSKLNKNKIKPIENKPGNETANGVDASVSVVTEAEATEGVGATVMERELASLQGVNASKEVDDSEDTKEIHITSLVIDKDVNVVEHIAPPDETLGNPLDNQSSALDSVMENDDETLKKSVSFDEEQKFSDDCGIASPGLSIHPMPESLTKHLSSALIVEEKGIRNVDTPGSPEISVIEESTPASNGIIYESAQSRKKWDGPESSPKSVKGFRKLLMFGRKS